MESLPPETQPSAAPDVATQVTEALLPSEPSASVASAAPVPAPPALAEHLHPSAASPAPDSGDQTAALLATISAALERLAVSSEDYHGRAAQRESVVDHLQSELDRLRRGERRGLLRPLLVESCRLRNDLLRQAEDLPDDFDADRTRLLLRSYAESMELTLEDNGVLTFAPERGDQFNPRLHRRVGGEPMSDPALAGRIARVRRSGYLDGETSVPIAPAEVVLFAASAAAESNSAPEPAPTDGERKRS